MIFGKQRIRGIEKLGLLCLFTTLLLGCQGTAPPPTETPNKIQVALTAAAMPAAATPTTPPANISMSAEAEAYLHAALTIIRENALYADRVDWVHMETAALIGANFAYTPKQTYPAIRYVLEALKDNHSFLLTPEEVAFLASQSDADNPAVSARIVAERLGYINVPGFISLDTAAITQRATTIQAYLAQQAERGACGWIVDLRENQGGNMFPMLAGLGPLIGEGVLGYFVALETEPIPWGYVAGKADLNGEPRAEVTRPFRFPQPNPPVALLIGPRTASAGEAMVIAFKGRPQTRLFGSPTYGLSTSNSEFELSDGAMILLTTAALADRNQHPYGGKIMPDEAMVGEAATEAAAAWLLEQPACLAED